MTFPVNLLSQTERDILSFLAKHRESQVLRYKPMQGDGLQAHGEGATEDFEVNTPSFARLVVSSLVINCSGDLYCITHEGLQCVYEFEK